MKQTAVEWLGYELNTKLFYDITPELWEQVNEIFNKALQMEREQIEDAYVECYMNHVGNGESILREANSYYKNTYGGNNE